MSTKISAISTGTGNAVAADVLAGKTFTNSSSAGLTGTMTNRGAVAITPSASSQAIPAGYHNGSGSVAAVSVPAANVLTGTTIAGTGGTMPNRGAVSITPGTSAQTIQDGYHNGSGTVAGDANLTAANILSGVSIFGVAGNVIAGKRYASGTGTVSSSLFAVSGLAFTPKIVLIDYVDPVSSNRFRMVYAADYNASMNGQYYRVNPIGSGALTNNWIVSGGSFSCGIGTTGGTFNWIAYE